MKKLLIVIMAVIGIAGLANDTHLPGGTPTTENLVEHTKDGRYTYQYKTHTTAVLVSETTNKIWCVMRVYSMPDKESAQVMLMTWLDSMGESGYHPKYTPVTGKRYKYVYRVIIGKTTYESFITERDSGKHYMHTVEYNMQYYQGDK